MSRSVTATPAVQQKPLFVTLGIHAVLLLLLFFWRLSIPGEPLPALPEMGMEVNLGTSADGSGIDQPMDIEDPAAAAASASRSAASASATSDVERSDADDAPSIADPIRNRGRQSTNPVNDRRTTTATASTATAPAAQVQRPRYVYPGSTGKGGNSAAVNVAGTSEGNTTGNGDRGVPGGTPGASNYTGSPGTGTGGISHSLDGRGIVAFPPKEARFREGGRVTVRVTVNRDGAIVNQQVVRSTNSELTPIALGKLRQVRFNRSETAPQEQFGNITFEFKTRQ